MACFFFNSSQSFVKAKCRSSAHHFIKKLDWLQLDDTYGQMIVQIIDRGREHLVSTVSIPIEITDQCRAIVEQ